MTTSVNIPGYALVVRADRLLSILLLLQARGRMSAGDLADRLEVSRRTVYRDCKNATRSVSCRTVIRSAYSGIRDFPPTVICSFG